MSTHGRQALKIAGAGLVAGAGLAAAGALEAQAYVLRSRTIVVHREERSALPDRQPLRILHLSDLHLMPYNERRSKWVAALAALSPDLVVATGDFLSSPDSLTILARTLAPFEGVPGVFVYGSNDYYAPVRRNPFRYLFRDSRPDSDRLATQEALPTDEMTSLLEGLGWVNLNNARARVEAAGWTLDFAGVDDPHIDRDVFPEVDGLAEGSDDETDVRIGVTHAPYVRVLDRMVADGRELIFAGHTHGGQISVPGYGAIITNSDLPRQLASGTFPWISEAVNDPQAWASYVENIRYDGGLEVAPGDAGVTVSAGLGTSPFVPIRIDRRPEAILVSVVAER